ncbi:putative HTH-type transcriptional regulator YkuM [Weizmannia acidilactici]|uniref:HTH-type transcriptional regulator YkuM n=1 Tax=Weizmannia acidilactici TaxID=2607726 RepID=A0A5J4JHS3_9BACI|nr:LysR family transcriptional regulator [Weizmannia acidilactici]GER70849.1 putative HTH-type transcriptional regulator YkuM [Weizmannia acidilactici]GER74968.1 putative HTH-type transcriptional regulator YkuM [Weizmannia acidilactici]
MSFSEFQLLSVLAQELNMRKAAERLFVSQPALSQRLQSIEKQWGAQLFLRTQKGLVVTPAGEIVIQLANEILEKEEKVREAIRTLDSKVHGTLKIACATIVGQNWLPKVLKKFVEKYPYAKISLITGWSSEILRSIYEDEVHIGIVRGLNDWKSSKIHLFEDPLYLVDREIDSLEEVPAADRPFIQFKSDSNYYQEIMDWWHREFQTSPKQTIVVDQIETCKQMVFNGIGYAILPAITLNGAEIRHLHKIPLQGEHGEPLKRDTWLLGYDAAFELKQVRAFVEVVEEYIAARPHIL